MENKTRMVTLHKHDTADGVGWQIEVDGVNTSIGLTQKLMDDMHATRRCGMIDEIVDVIVESLAGNNYTLTNQEKKNLNTLLQCMT